MLFDLHSDPDEFDDLGADPAQAPVLHKLYGHLHEWALRMSQRVTMSDEKLAIKRGSPQREGILVGVHHAEDLAEKFTYRYLGPARQVHFENEEDRERYAGGKPRDRLHDPL